MSSWERGRRKKMWRRKSMEGKFEESKGGGPEEWRRRDDVRKVTKGGGDRMSLKN